MYCEKWKTVLNLLMACVLSGCASTYKVAQDYGITRQEMVDDVAHLELPMVSPRVHLNRIGNNGYILQLREVDISAAQQKSPAGCWAACVEMALKYNGIQADQNQIIESIKGVVRNDGRDAGSVTDMIRSVYRPGCYINVTAPTAWEMAVNLIFDSPILLTLKPSRGQVGHVVVVTGIEFSLMRTPFLPDIVLHKIEYFDPGEGKLLQKDASELRESVINLVQFRRSFAPAPIQK